MMSSAPRSRSISPSRSMPIRTRWSRSGSPRSRTHPLRWRCCCGTCCCRCRCGLTGVRTWNGPTPASLPRSSRSSPDIRWRAGRSFPRRRSPAITAASTRITTLSRSPQALGVDLLPARMMRPSDKAACERAFAGIQSLLLELLLGYRGVDVADRGTDPEGDAVWTLREMEHLLATWIVKVWQNRRLDQYAPAWDPGGRHSPNTLFAAAAARDGICLEIPRPGLYYELLPAHFVKIDRRRGVKIGGLWYGGGSPVLDPYRGRPSGRSGRHCGKWAISRDPRDCREVFFEDPADGSWHALRWNGLPAGDDVPAFSDARVRELLREAARSGLKPREDGELLPVLLDLVASRTPVEAWPTQMSKKQQAERARELARARQAAADRPPASPAPLRVLPPAAALPELAGQTRQAVTDDRRRRREAALVEPPRPPPLLADALRARSVFALPDEDEDEDEAVPGPNPEPA